MKRCSGTVTEKSLIVRVEFDGLFQQSVRDTRHIVAPYWPVFFEEVGVAREIPESEME
jgi:hypothetical protein